MKDVEAADAAIVEMEETSAEVSVADAAAYGLY